MAMVDLKSPEGTVSGYLAIPKKGHGPGVLVLHAWWGLNDFFKGLCDRLATDGFVAFAPDVYRGATASTRDGAENLMSKVDQTAAERDIRSGLRGLQSHPGVRGKHLGVMGFSMGAFWSLWLAQTLPPTLAQSSSSTGPGTATIPGYKQPSSVTSPRRTNLSPLLPCEISRRSFVPLERTSRSTHIRGRRTGFSRMTDRTRSTLPQPSSRGNEQFDS